MENCCYLVWIEATKPDVLSAISTNSKKMTMRKLIEIDLKCKMETKGYHVGPQPQALSGWAQCNSVHQEGVFNCAWN